MKLFLIMTIIKHKSNLIENNLNYIRKKKLRYLGDELLKFKDSHSLIYNIK